MTFRTSFACIAICAGALVCTAAAQQPSLPDAPSAQRPATAPTPLRKPPALAAPAAPQALPAPAAPTKTAPSAPPPATTDTAGDLFKLTKNVNLVLVPVSVEDRRGHPVDGLEKPDFTVYDDGAKQPIQLFTAEPFPLSVAVVVDTMLDDAALQKLQNTLSSLVGAFGDLDEIAIYAYEASVRRLADFSPPSALDDAVHTLRWSKIPDGGLQGPFDTDREHGQTADEQRRRGLNPGITGGPLGTTTTVGGRPMTGGLALHRGALPILVLNDAVLAAAQDLARRDRSRRRMLFVISDGVDHGSVATPPQALRALLSGEIAFYGLRIGDWSVPAYRLLNRLPNLRGRRSGLLDRYAAPTGGSTVTAIRRNDLEDAYGFLAERARTRYTLGYIPPPSAPGAYRKIAVVVDLPRSRVHSRTGYYSSGMPAPASDSQ